ncbi:hypothetical protein ANO11243_047170 [Dothideomycetidae sp. 11243]|nr:hypothetical protein ANO11243_047170 [fungal sp. No.11243]
MALRSPQSLPSRPAQTLDYHHSRLAPAPRYSAQAFDTSYPSPAYKNYSDSLLDPSSSISEYGYDSSNLAPRKPQSDSFGSRVFSAFSEAVKPPTNSSPSSRSASLHTRARSLADSAGPMLARANSIRLGGLLNRTPTQKQSTRTEQPSEETEQDIEECEELPEYKPTFTDTPDRASRRQSTPRTPVRPSSSRGGRFAWFGQSKSDSDATLSADLLELSDPLLDLNVNAALFPTGATDPLDPDSFNSLLTNACALISRLQTGYREKNNLLKQANAERDAAREETDEAATRVAHLKSQLETMALKAAEQDRAMRDLAAELTTARARLESARHGSGSDVSENDETPRRRNAAASRKQRTSDGVASDSGFESDADAESISYSIDTASTASVPATPGTSFDAMRHSFEEQPSGVFRMTPGKNVSSAGAWNVVGDLQRENTRLRGRVRELEGAVEGCLSLVGS